MSNWFNDIFLQSLFKRSGHDRSLWLTAKQTNVCIMNMEKEVFRYGDVFDSYGTHYTYHCFWQNREVRLEYSKKNCCGKLFFGMTDEEKEKSEKESLERSKIEKEERYRSKVNRIQKNPDRYRKFLDEGIRTLSDIISYICDDKIKIRSLRKEYTDSQKESVLNELNEYIEFLDDDLAAYNRNIEKYRVYFEGFGMNPPEIC